MTGCLWASKIDELCKVNAVLSRSKQPAPPAKQTLHSLQPDKPQDLFSQVLRPVQPQGVPQVLQGIQLPSCR